MITRMIKVEVFSSPGCGKCGHASEVLRRLADELCAHTGARLLLYNDRVVRLL